RYYDNYHIWETLIRWDAPEYYGVACKRLDTRAEHNKSVFNLRRTMPQAFNQILQQAKAEVLVVSYNDEAWISPEAMIEALSSAGYSDVRLFSYDSRRYVGAQIGIHSPQGTKVGEVSHLRNTEYIFVAGPSEQVEAAAVALATTPATATQEQECNQPPPAKVTDGG
ncbi:MAG: hypothetical protein LBG70_02700, partial [Bifidobacteriaceae bacterium]|nr:hypothetical protein [Bifidobacteriaceae bacterium]